MKKLTSLSFLFTVVALVEVLYAALGLLIPPDMVQPLTGWVLTSDGQWLAKLLGVALGFQAVIAWMFRKNPHISIAWAFAGYQLLAATVDWVMWLTLSGDGIFASPLAQSGVIASVVLHYALGILLIVGIRNAKRSEVTHI